MTEVYFFFQKLADGTFEQSICYDTLEEAVNALNIAFKNRDPREEFSPVIQGWN